MEIKQEKRTEDSGNRSNTPYDDAFRTMIEKGGKLRIPFLNEMFHLKDPIAPDTLIENVANEYFISEGNGKQKKIITDSVLHIGNRTFHVECQSTADGSILVRMFEYDISIALNEREFQDNHLTVHIPMSGILFLRRIPGAAENLTVTIQTRGGSVSYAEDILYLADYTLDDLIRKKLLFLFPFYLFNLEQEFGGFEKGNEASRQKVGTLFRDLLQHVNDLYQSREISCENYLLITDMIRKVTDSLTRKYNRVRKELDSIMGGKVLKFKGEDIYKEGLAEGKAEGKAEGRAEGKVEGIAEGKILELIELVHEGAFSVDYAANRAEKKYGIKKEDFRKMLDSYEPDDELMQG